MLPTKRSAMALARGACTGLSLRTPRAPGQQVLGDGAPHPPRPTSRNGFGCGSSPVAGRIVRTARRRVLHIDPDWPWANTITIGHARLATLPAP